MDRIGHFASSLGGGWGGGCCQDGGGVVREKEITSVVENTLLFGDRRGTQLL